MNHQQVDLPGDQIRHGRTGATVRDELNLCTGQLLQQNARHLSRRILVDERDLAGICLHPGDKPLQIIRRQRLLGDHELRIDGDQPDRLEILLQIVVQGIDDAADMGVPLTDVDRIAVGRRARDAPDRDTASRAADVFDDDWLAKQRPHLLSHNAPDHIGRSARREWDDDRELT